MAEAIQLTGWAHVGIRVHDLDRARAFYELLGFQFVAGPMGPEPVAIMHHPSGIEINFILNAAESSTTNQLMDVDIKHAGFTHIALFTSDLEDAQRRLEDAGFPITEGPLTFPSGIRAMFVRDPDGNVIELDEPPK